MLKNMFKRIEHLVFYKIFSSITRKLDNIHDNILLFNNENLIRYRKNNFNVYGRQIFSQSDEDGLTIEIIKRCNITNKFFLEIGSGSGIENNTLILLALNWSGCWVDAQKFIIEESKRLKLINKIVDCNNVNNLYKDYEDIIKNKIAFLSIDIDGNDYYILEILLENKNYPDIIIVEYNPLFPPPMKFKSKNIDNVLWRESDHSASLTTYNDLMMEHDYFCVCCNLFTGNNAFFVKNKYKENFKEIPTELDDIYCSPRHYLKVKNHHVITKQLIENLIK